MISGCGITYEAAPHKTWPRVLKCLGYNIIDTSGPAVSNQWIFNKSLSRLVDEPDIHTVILQLTDIGKLDVEMDQSRLRDLVVDDSRRNFVITPQNAVIRVDQHTIQDIADGAVWPSSFSQDHAAKQSWRRYLYSGGLELEDIFCKLIMLKAYCDQRDIDLLVFQGYDLPWHQEHSARLTTIVKNINTSFSSEYHRSIFYQAHDHSAQNFVPCFAYQVQIAQEIAQYLEMDDISREKLNRIITRYNDVK